MVLIKYIINFIIINKRVTGTSIAKLIIFIKLWH